jgi:ribose-phosphate pyrophosphokinase
MIKSIAKTLIFAFPGYEAIATRIRHQLNLKMGQVVVRHFPDGESFVRLDTEVKGKKVVLV